MFTDYLDPPDFGRIGHPALTVALWITSRETWSVEDHPETPTSAFADRYAPQCAQCLTQKLIFPNEPCM
jgi:hypothetical protein